MFAGRDAVIEDSFFKVNDDAVKLFQSNLMVRRVVVWQEDNGQSFMLSWITPTNESNITVIDCTVIHVEHDHDYGDNARPAVFGAVHGGPGHISMFRFENIVIEGPVLRLVGLSVSNNPWAPGTSPGSIREVEFDGLITTDKAPQRIHSLIHGLSKTASVADVRIRDLQYGGSRAPYISSAREAGFDIDPSTTHDIRFLSEGGGSDDRMAGLGRSDLTTAGFNEYGGVPTNLVSGAGKVSLMQTTVTNNHILIKDNSRFDFFI